MSFGPNKLPKKDYEIFTEIIKCYENKQYRKGLKLSDQILKRNPQHGETEAMKGLLCNSLGRKEEGYDYVKSGLKHDIKSSVCWHVYGLLYKSDNNFKEAIKCYLNALKFDPESPLILKDLSFLQIQMRDANGFLNTRGRMLACRPQQRASWVAYALANYLAKDYKSAFDNINKYNDMITERGDKYEENELVLFQNKCLEEQGKYAAAIDHLLAKDSIIVDKHAAKIKLAELYTLSGKFDTALENWTSLVKEYSENYRMHAGLQTAILKFSPKICKEIFRLKGLQTPMSVLNLSEAQKDAVYSYYFIQGFKGRSINRILLDAAPSGQFERMLDMYIRKSLESGIPSLFEDLCSLIRALDPTDSEKLIYVSDISVAREHPIMIEVLRLLNIYIESIPIYGTYHHPTSSSESPDAFDHSSSPQSLLWVKYLKSQILEFSGLYDEALQLIEECIEHTPTGLDMYIKKADILKKTGQIQLAARVMDYCRSLDLQDRFLNNKATEFLLQADKIEEAQATIALFTKHDGDPETSLYDLQCSWYEIELGEAFARTKQYGMALKKFYAILTHFYDFLEDMFDFHGYCIRKSTLRIYTEVLKAQDNQYSHPYYQRAYRGAVSLLLYLLDNPSEIPPPKEAEMIDSKDTSTSSTSSSTSTPSSSSSSSSSLPSAPSSSAKDADLDKDDDAEEDSVKKPADTDPHGEKLLRKDFLVEANIWSSHLENRLSAIDLSTLLLFVEVKVRRKEYVKAIEALREAHTRYPNDPDLVYSTVHLYVNYLMDALADLSCEQSSNTKSDVEALKSLETLLGENGIVGYLERYNTYIESLESFQSFPAALSYSRGLALIASYEKFGISTDLIVTSSERVLKLMDQDVARGVTTKTVAAALQFAKSTISADLNERYLLAGKRAFPHWDIFKTSDELMMSSARINSDPNRMVYSQTYQEDAELEGSDSFRDALESQDGSITQNGSSTDSVSVIE